jgi:DNA replication protein DnaC
MFSAIEDFRPYAMPDVAKMDDFGLSTLTDTERKDLLGIIEDRYGSGSTIIASQLPITEWHRVIGEPTIADAICDRILYDVHKIELKGESMPKTKTFSNG